MFGDPTLKDALASSAQRPGEEGLPARTADADGASLRPVDAGPDSARLAIPDEPLPESPAPALPPPPHADPGLDAAVDQYPFAASEHPTGVTPPAEPHNGARDAGEAFPAETEALAADAGVAPLPDASDAASIAPKAPREEGLGAKVAETGSFGAFFMMPPGSSEQEGLQDPAAGPMIAPPRFRDELMFVRDTDGNPITADATILAEPEPTADPPIIGPPPASEPEPVFMEPPAPLLEDPPAAPFFPVFSVVSPHPEPDTGFDDASPLPPEPEPPEAPRHPDAAARIAAEADATAAALENLERLLEQKRPYLQAVAPAYRPDPFLERATPSAAQADSLRLRMQRLEPEPPSFPRPPERAPLLPLPTPPPRGRRSVYIVGFLTGLALSLMAGLVLYFFILYGGPS
jgi:hypothetical protein